jgi:hypothetical protein
MTPSRKRKGFTIAGCVAAAIVVALAPAVGLIYGEAYPADDDRRLALAACGHDQPGFNRWLARERSRCYVGLRQGPPPAKPALVPRRIQMANLPR